MRRLTALLRGFCLCFFLILGAQCVAAENMEVQGNSSLLCSTDKDASRVYSGVVRDGIIPPPNDLSGQYPVLADNTGEAWIGYRFPEPFSVNTVLFTDGQLTETDGWFHSVRIEVLINDVWYDAGAYSDPEYPPVRTAGERPAEGRTYAFVMEPILAEGVRLIGTPAGEDACVLCSELSVLCDVDLKGYASLKEYIGAAGNSGNIEELGTPVAYEMNPDVSGGSRDISVICDGYVPMNGDPYNRQYDTVSNKGKAAPGHTEYIGYMFPSEVIIRELVFTEGGNFYDGGWFRDGSLTVEINRNYSWEEVSFACLPAYPDSDDRADFLPDYETYTLTLDEPVSCRGVRLAGIAGGSAHFISCGELQVLTIVEEKARDYHLTPPDRVPEKRAEPSDTAETGQTGGAGGTLWIVLGGAGGIAVTAAVLILSRRKGRRTADPEK